MKLFNLLPLASLASGLILFAPGAQAQQHCKHTSEWSACFFSNGTYAIRFKDGSGIDGQCNSGARWSNPIPFVLANQLHESFCGVSLDLMSR